jgi:hypothetical protein
MIAYPEEFRNETGKLSGINLGTPRDKEWFAAGKLKIIPYQIFRRPVPDHLTDVMLKRAVKTPKEGVPLIENVFDFLEIKKIVGSDSPRFVGQETPFLLRPTNLILEWLPSPNRRSRASESRQHRHALPFHHIR